MTVVTLLRSHLYSTATYSFFMIERKTAYVLRISDWSSDVCSSDLQRQADRRHRDKPDGAGLHRPRIGSWRSGSATCRADRAAAARPLDRKSVVLGKGVADRLDLGGRRFTKTQSHENLYIASVVLHTVT